VLFTWLRKPRAWLALGLVVLVGLLAWLPVRTQQVNAQVVEEIRANPQGERAARTMIIFLADGRVYPVNYLREDDLVFMGIDGRWWRAFQSSSEPVEMVIQGQRLSGHAQVVLDDPEYVVDVFARLRPKAPSWLPLWLNGKLVVITLQPD
jgi:hypothetical protein